MRVDLPPARRVDSPTVLDLDVDDVAQHLTYIDSRLFRAIQPSECLRRAWEKPQLKHTATIVMRFNHMLRTPLCGW